MLTISKIQIQNVTVNCMDCILLLLSHSSTSFSFFATHFSQLITLSQFFPEKFHGSLQMNILQGKIEIR